MMIIMTAVKKTEKEQIQNKKKLIFYNIK